MAPLLLAWLSLGPLAARGMRAEHSAMANRVAGWGVTGRTRRCCCDVQHYDPPQCKLFVWQAETEDTSKGAVATLLAPLLGGSVCPLTDLFANDGVGPRPTAHRAGGRGCADGEARGAAAALGFEGRAGAEAEDAAWAEASPVNMDIPQSTEYLIMLKPPKGEDFDSYAPKEQKLILMSHWKVELKKQLGDTLTGRPTYQLLMHLQADGFHHNAEVATLPLYQVEQISRVDVDGAAAVELQLNDDRQLLLIPFAPGPAPELDADGGVKQSAKPMDWGRKRDVCCLFFSVEDAPEGSSRLVESCGWYGIPSPFSCAASDTKFAEELGRQLVKAKQVAQGSDKQPVEEGHGPRMLFKTLYPTAMRCHSEAELRSVIKEGWSGPAGAEVRTFKAIKGGSGLGGVTGFLRDVFGRHQHMKLGGGNSCIDLVREGASERAMKEAGCTPYTAKAGVTAVVRECLDAVSSVEMAKIRAWGIMAKAYIKKSRIFSSSLKNLGFEPVESWQKLLADDVQRIEDFRMAALMKDMTHDKAGVWHILQRASIYAQKFIEQPELYMQNVERKLNDVDKTFWKFIEKPSDMHQYPHAYNGIGPRDLVETAAYRELMDDSATFAEHLAPRMMKSMNQSAQGLSQALAECVRSLDCADPPLLLKMLQRVESPDLWNEIPLRWLAGLPHAPPMNLTAPSSSSNPILPRPTVEAYGGCFSAPHETVLAERKLKSRLEEKVDQFPFLKKNRDHVFQLSSSSLRGDDVLERIGEALEDSAGLPVEDVGASSVQGALACYPTLFGMLGMEAELRDETGYNAGGKRTEDMEQVLGQCAIAPQCARLAVERILYFNTKRWDMHSRLKVALFTDKVACSPDPKIPANCQVFARCFRASVEHLCDELPGCCSREPGQAVCSSNSAIGNIWTTASDMATVLNSTT